MTNKANVKLNKTRQQLIDMFVAALEEEKLPWRKEWHTLSVSANNPVSHTKYQGVNAFYLMLVSYNNNYDDPRWCTFKQAQDRGWYIKKGSHGYPVEYWSIYDKINKKNISFSDYHHEINNVGRDAEEFRLVSRTYTVFNAACIEGIPPLEIDDSTKHNDIAMDVFIQQLIQNMQVGYREYGTQAYYSPPFDEVVMPPRKCFESQAAFTSTCLHELAHATAHSSRLNRDTGGCFGNEAYAIEELRAEMSSVFLSQHLNIELNNDSLDNHKAYIQSWAEKIKDDPNCLFRAIKDAEAISDYMIQMGEREIILQAETKNKVENLPIYLDTAIAFAKRNNSDNTYAKEVNDDLER